MLEGIRDAWDRGLRPDVLGAAGGRAFLVSNASANASGSAAVIPSAAPTVHHVATAASTARRIAPARARVTPKDPAAARNASTVA